MISQQIAGMALMLRKRPDLISAVADRLDELAECAAQLEQACVPPHLRPEVLAEAGVVRLDDHRRRPCA